MSYVKQTVVATGLLALSAVAGASQIYGTTFTTLNDSGVTGSTTLAYNSDNNTLNVGIHAQGLEGNRRHLAHIHGVIGGDSVTPTLASSDSNGDGLIQFVEAIPQYGAIIVPLTQPPGGDFGTPADFPLTPADGVLNFNQTYDLSQSNVFNKNYTEGNLFPLTNREIVLHGLTVNGDYSATLPVAAGEITAQGVPEPADIGILALGLAMIGTLLGIRKRGSIKPLRRA